ncbi:MAG: tetratricopeptide repeat protein, partial [Pseudomonadota bacterium]
MKCPATDSELVDRSLQQAVAQHRAGNLQEAEALYRAILRIRPDHPEANHNMGVLTRQTKQAADGLAYFLAALEADPTCSRYWLSYIDALIQAGRLEDARQVLALAQQQGLESDEVAALAERLQDGLQDEEEQNAEQQDAIDESPAPTIPDQHEIDALVALFSAGQLEQATSLAQSMTVRFPA